jgi:hypothetical protein
MAARIVPLPHLAAVCDELMDTYGLTPCDRERVDEAAYDDGRRTWVVIGEFFTTTLAFDPHGTQRLEVTINVYGGGFHLDEPEDIEIGFELLYKDVPNWEVSDADNEHKLSDADAWRRDLEDYMQLVRDFVDVDTIHMS